MDLARNKRSIIITSGEDPNNPLNEVFVSDTYAMIPNFYIERRIWLNLVIDIKNLYN